VVINRKKGNVFRYFGMDGWKYRVRDAKKQIVSQIGDIKTKFIGTLM
jgi:predicted methyltransferase